METIFDNGKFEIISKCEGLTTCKSMQYPQYEICFNEGIGSRSISSRIIEMNKDGTFTKTLCNLPNGMPARFVANTILSYTKFITSYNEQGQPHSYNGYAGYSPMISKRNHLYVNGDLIKNDDFNFKRMIALGNMTEGEIETKNKELLQYFKMYSDFLKLADDEIEKLYDNFKFKPLHMELTRDGEWIVVQEK